MSRVHILEIIELRAMNWQVVATVSLFLREIVEKLSKLSADLRTSKKLTCVFFQPNDNVTAFYKQKLSQLEFQHLDQIPPATPGGMDSPGVCTITIIIANIDHHR